ncbi:hypothetical protein [Clostridium tetani]|nr:hypothetical protein [Clostridium tetani]
MNDNLHSDMWLNYQKSAEVISFVDMLMIVISTLKAREQANLPI